MSRAQWPDSTFFILGSQRSGTTLMRLVLDRHSQINCLEEAPSYLFLKGCSAIVPSEVTVGLKVPQLTEQFDRPVLRDDAAVRDVGLPAVINHYSRQKLVYLIRDVRDTVASMKGLRDWFRRFGQPVLTAKAQQDVRFASTYRQELDTLRTTPNTVAAGCALIWRYKTDALVRYQSRGWPVLGIRYEELVRAPQVVITRVLAFLDFPWQDAVVQPASRWLATPTVGGSLPSREIDATSIGRWKQILTTDEARTVMAVAGKTQTRFYGSATGEI